MPWIAKPTGDMTLSILDEEGFQILKVDMLSQNTMQAGTQGSKLARALNDLTIIARFADMKTTPEENLPYEDDGYSPKPWRVVYTPKTKTMKICSAEKKICERKFPVTTSNEKIDWIYSVIMKGIDNFNEKEE